MPLYRFAIFLLTPLCHLFFRLRFEGLENIPPDGGLVLIGNHRSYIDPIFLAIGIKRRQVHYMAKAELFKWGPFGFILRKLGAFAVERGTGDASALDTAKDMVAHGGILGIFIEGTRSLDGVPLRPKSGAAMVARVTGGDVLPCAICLEGRVRMFKRITIKYGEILKNEDLGFANEATPTSLKRASHIMMDRIKALLGVETHGD